MLRNKYLDIFPTTKKEKMINNAYSFLVLIILSVSYLISFVIMKEIPIFANIIPLSDLNLAKHAIFFFFNANFDFGSFAQC